MAAEHDDIPSSAKALEAWRAAERASADIHDTRIAAESAAALTREAVNAAGATTEAAEAVVASSLIAEASARKSEEVAKAAASATVADLADVQDQEAVADGAQAAAKLTFRKAVAKAEELKGRV